MIRAQDSINNGTKGQDDNKVPILGASIFLLNLPSIIGNTDPTNVYVFRVIVAHSSTSAHPFNKQEQIQAKVFGPNKFSWAKNI